MRVAWATDIHLDAVSPPQYEKFTSAVRAARADVLLIAGDIGHSFTLESDLPSLYMDLDVPVYFVLGNHDYWGHFIDGTRATARRICRNVPGLVWLPDAGTVLLSSTVALVGHDGWADTRNGDYEQSDLVMSDSFAIRDFGDPEPSYARRVRSGGGNPRGSWPFSDEGKRARRELMMKLGDESAAHVRTHLPPALARAEHVLYLTHVPPFAEACLSGGEPADAMSLPHFTCRAVGDALTDIMARHPSRRLTVLCGHTHCGAQVDILDNLSVCVGPASYTQPALQQCLEL